MLNSQHNSSSLLDLEAADYFKLDPSQLNLLSVKSCHDRTSKENKNLAEKISVVLKKSTLNDDNGTNKMLGQKNPAPRAYRKREQPQAKPKEEQAKITKTRASNRKTSSYHHHKVESPHTSLSVGPTRFRSPSISTSSLPSIASSPSLSPSLVCPHVSLDDILEKHNDGRNRSAHTIGLCERCLVCPPPDIHSPLSPAFRPSVAKRHVPQVHLGQAHQGPSSKRLGTNMVLRRGYSDQQMGASRGRNLGLTHDDSLDYYLAPEDLRRLQMSPTIRNSVEYIRNNTTEAGRVVRIYKNGHPFDKPLRICILRGEFANLNHLLDHINSRQLIPSGARYLFHLDGQLVYSENELKHGSCYVVSGTRSFDFKINSVLKEQQKNYLTRRAPINTALVGQSRQYRSQSQQLIRQESFVREKVVEKPRTGASLSTKGTLGMIPTSSILRRKNSQEKLPASRMVDSVSQTQVCIPKIVKTVEVPIIKLPPKKSNTKKVATPTSSTLDRKPAKHQEISIKSEIKSSRGNDILASPKNIEHRPKSVVRAKSELSALPRSKQKKNVTFVDTGRGSSPAINLKSDEESITSAEFKSQKERVAQREKPALAEKDLETSEIGIQVSDSLDGFLIDLPIPLAPERTKESPASGPTMQKRLQKASGSAERKHGKFVTISERQLSLDEMGQLKDMDQGDHHNDSHKIQHVSITLAPDNLDEESTKIEPEPVEAVLPDRSDTINIGQELGENEAPIKYGQPDSGQWQYPDDPQRPGTSATPTERPVSQSEANETVHARVTTPTPSLSTMGDSTSLTMSYDYSHQQSENQTSIEATMAAIANLPDKQRVPVIGALRQGVDPPIRNFKLVWVNGFIINDLYPENSIIAAFAAGDTTSNHAGTKSPASGLLTPTDIKRLPVSQFKPSDRFHNWVCHSRRHDELIYPAGSLVILWCRWTDEQRYYSGHTSNITAITLASLDDDLAASAQIGDLNDRTINSSIHIWSLSSLETLRVVDDDNFRNRRIFSLKVRNTQLDGCEVSAASREDKSISFYVFFLRLDTYKEQAEVEGGDSKSKQPSPRRATQIVIRANKALQVNQNPLLLTRLSNVRRGDPKLGRKSSLTNQRMDPFGNVMISFGRRHFQVWFVDRKRQNLVPMQSINKSSYFVELIVRANCSVRMLPSEFLVGDSNGNLALLVIKLHQTTDSKTITGIPSRTLQSNYKYSIDTWPLIDGSTSDSLGGNSSARTPITCLARVSGSLFITADHNCAIKFWKIIRSTTGDDDKQDQSKMVSGSDVRCHQLGCFRLPKDLGFICTIIQSKYSRRQPISVEFYAISTSNAILFGSVQLKSGTGSLVDMHKDRAPISCSLSVIYEGHESPAMSLVADPLPKNTKPRNFEDSTGKVKQYGDFFTCSLDCKICRWSGKSLVWKSMLPSACASLAVHPIGFVLAIGSADGTVYILDKISGLLISYFPLTPVCINCLAYSRDGTLLAAGCANGSIFILPVYERGLKYKKVSILQSPHPVVSLQFSVDNKYILTSVTHGLYQELILWDLPNFRYMRNNVKMAADKIEWFDSICSGSEDVRAIWENANLDSTSNEINRSKLSTRRMSLSSSEPINTGTTVNLSCHRLIRRKQKPGSDEENFVIASDTRGYLRLFRYPCSNIQQGFYETRIGSSAMSCCRFLALKDTASVDEAMFVSSSLDGSICLWSLN